MTGILHIVDGDIYYSVNTTLVGLDLESDDEV
jgi:hypothetical protein